MNRLANVREPVRVEMAVRLFQQTVSKWAADLLRNRPRLQWPKPDPAADYNDRNWKSLYAGSVLDD